MLHTSLAKSQNEGILFNSTDTHMKINLCLSVDCSVLFLFFFCFQKSSSTFCLGINSLTSSLWNVGTEWEWEAERHRFSWQCFSYCFTFSLTPHQCLLLGDSPLLGKSAPLPSRVLVYQLRVLSSIFRNSFITLLQRCFITTSPILIVTPFYISLLSLK